MKRIKYFVLVFVCLFAFGKINVVKADWAGCYSVLSDSSPVDIGDEFEYIIGSDGITYDTYITGLHFTIQYDKSALEPISVSSFYDWENVTANIEETNLIYNNYVVDLKTSLESKYVSDKTNGINSSGFVKLASIKFKVKDVHSNSVKIFLTEDERNTIGAAAYTEKKSYKYTYTKDFGHDKESCTNTIETFVNLYRKAALSDIKIDNTTVSGFNSSTYNYNIKVNKSEINISADGDAQSSKVTGDLGKKTLNYGNNQFKIQVTSTTNDVKEYTLNIDRPDNRSNINTLKSLSLSEEEISFNPSTLVYNISVDYKVDSLRINSELSDSKSTYIKNYGNRLVNLDVGVNEVLVKVKAENGDIKIYTLYITRNERNDSCNIKELNVRGYKIDFKETTSNYKLIINPEDTKLDISVKLADSDSKYEVEGNENLEDGSTIKIKVIDKKNNEKEYFINIVKEFNIKENNMKIIIITAISSVIVVLGIVFCIYFFIIKKKARRR